MLHRRPFLPVEILADEQIDSIHLASLEVLRDVGVEVLHPEARQLLVAAGCRFDGAERIYFDPDAVEAAVATAPSVFTLHAPNPAHDVQIGDDSVVFTSVASAPNVIGNGHARRSGNRADFQNLVRLTQALNAIQIHAGYPVEPSDIHASVRHLHATHDILTLSDKAPNVYSLGAQRNDDCLEMVRIARGVSDEQLDEQPSVTTVINTNSPLRIDHPMAEGLVRYARRGQVCIVTPFTLAGAMAPISISGALVQQNAEALAGITIAQLARPGAPVVYGGFTSNVDMRSGAPAFGTPEFMQAALVGGQLARRYGLPYRSSNVCAANVLDAQAGYESVFSLWGAVMGGANIVFHGAGWMEGGLHASFEKMVLDADLISMVGRFLQPLSTEAADLAVETIREVGPGGHFFGSAQTQAGFRTAFFKPMVSDWSNHESWIEAGSPTALDHAERLVDELLDGYEAPVLDQTVRDQLEDFVAHRVAEGGVFTDF